MRVSVRTALDGARDLLSAPAGVRAFGRTRVTPTGTYRVMRKSLSVAPKLVPRASRLLFRTPAAVPDPDPVGVIGPMSGARLDDPLNRLRADGLARFERRLDPAICDALVRLAEETPAELMGGPAGPATAVFDPRRPRAPKYSIPEAALLADPTVQDLVVDPSLRALAAAYLGCEPVSTLVAMWWSVPTPGPANAEIAQLYHADRDHPAFLKYFVYLTDVDDDHGPHVYVRGSHRRRPRALRADRRFADDEVARHYPPEARASVHGERGTMFAADTIGLHKGLPPTEGPRLVFQVEFATTLFGAPYTRLAADGLCPKVASAVARHPHTFERFGAG